MTAAIRKTGGKTQRSNRGPMGFGGGSYERPKDVRGTFQKIFQLMSEYRYQMVIVFLLGIVSSLATVIGTYMLRPIINDIITPLIGKENPDLSGLSRMLLILAVIYLAGVLSTYLASRLMVTISSGTLRQVRVKVFEHVQNLPVSYFDTHTHGEIMSHFTNDAETLREMISNSLPNLISSAISIIGVVIAMILLSWQLFILVILQLVLIFLIIRVMGKRSSSYFIKQQRELATLNGYIEEMIEGQKVVKVFTHEKQVKATFNQQSNDLFEVAFRANMFSLIVIPILGSLSYVHYALTAGLGAVMAIKGLLDIGTIGAFLQYTRTFTRPINMASQQINSILSALAGAERIFALLDESVEVDEGTVTLVNVRDLESESLIECDEPTGCWAWKLGENSSPRYKKLLGDVRFEDVSFSYVPGAPVLRNVSLYAKPGQKIALVGSTGAGKTTIVNLLTRFYDVTEGIITYDGIDIRQIRKDDLRRSLSMVLQDVHLFTGTVAENIRYGNLSATDEQIEEAADVANAAFFITHLPESYQTVLIGDGANLSQGQRQLLAISRAAVKDPPVLILDEATSSIDTRTESLIEKGMDKLMEARTVFVIAHRLSTVRNSNAILVMEHGEIIERGDHESLLAQKGRYYQLYTGMFELS